MTMMPDFLHLPDLRTLTAHDQGDHYRVEAEGCVVPTECPSCLDTIYGHGRQRQTYLDTPMHGKRVLIEIARKRYRCTQCGKTCFEPLPDIDSKRHATRRLVAYIEQRCLRKTFLELAREVGVDDKTIRGVFDDYVARLAAESTPETPEVLGIDELKVVGAYRAMVTNVEKLTLFDMLPTRKKADLNAYFSRLPDKARVKVLVMDLWSVYRQVAAEQFPGRPVVADRFHVVRMANDAMEKVRKGLRSGLERRDRIKLKDDRFVLLSREANLTDEQRAKLEKWTSQYPELGAAYWAKEAFHAIYSHPDKKDAQQAAREWPEQIDASVDWAFAEVKGALTSWWTEIFNYYDHPVTNGYTESINNLAKGMNRMGRGYSFDVIRARLLFDTDARRSGRTSLRRKVRRKKTTVGFATGGHGARQASDYETVEEVSAIDYGAHIPTLVRKLEAGEFA